MSDPTIVISAVDKTSGVLKGIERGVGQLSGQFTALGAAVSGFAALAGVTAFTGMISKTVEAADSMNDLSKKTGLAVETLSGLELAAKQSGTDLEGVSQSINKLGINIAKDAEKFARIGVTAKEPLEAFKQLANVVSRIEDPQKRAAVAAEALGRSWQSAMPLLAEGGQKIQEMVDKGTKLSGMTQDLADKSDAFNDQMAELQTSLGGVAKSITKEMLPSLVNLSKEFALGLQHADGFFDAIKKYGLTNPFESYEAKLASLKHEFEQVDFRLSNDRAKSGDKELAKGLEQQIAYYTALTAKTTSAAKSTGDLTAAQKAGVNSFVKGASDLDTAATRAAKAAQVLADLRLDQMALINKQAAAEIAAIDKTYGDFLQTVEASVGPLEQQAEQLARQVEFYDLAESAIQATIIQRLEEQRVIAEGIDGNERQVYALTREIEARKAIASSSSQKEFLDANKKAAERSAREWEKTSDDINRALTDALMRGFEDGKSFGQNFVDSLKNSLKTAALRIVVNYVMNGAGQLVGTVGNAALNSVFGTAGSNGGAGTNYLGLASNASSLYSAYSNAGLAYQGLTGSMSLSNVAGTYYANATGTGLDGLLATNGAYGTAASGSGTASGAGASSGSGAGSGALGTVAWVAAIVAGMWMSSEAYKAGIRWENYAKDPDAKKYDAEVGLRAMTDKPMAALFGDDFVKSEFYAVMSGSSLSAQIHMALQKAMWGGPWKPNGQPQLQGTFSEAQGFSDGRLGQQYKKDGGWFSSTKKKWEWQDVSPAFDSAMDGMYSSIRDMFLTVGEVFEDDTLAAKLKGFTIRIVDGNARDMQAALGRVAETLTASMGGILFPSIQALRTSGETWSAAFARIVQESSAVTRVFDLMGKTMTGVFGQDNADGVLKASDALVKLFGTIAGFNASFGAYYGNFYTAAEQTDQAWADLAKQFAFLGQTLPTTRQGFRDLVDSLDLSTTAGQGTFGALMSLQGAFAALTPTLDDVAAAARANQQIQAQQIGKLLDTQRAAQAALVRDQISAAQAAVDSAGALAESFGLIVDGLSEYQRTLLGGPLSILSPADQYAESKRLYEATASAARLGDVAAADRLPTLADSFLQAARVVGTADSYARDFGAVLGTVDAVIGVANRQIPLAESQLQVAEAQLVALNAMLAKMTGGQAPIVVGNYQQAAADWASFFTTTALGDVVQNAAGTMQRISDSMGLFVDSAGAGYTFNAGDSPYALASVSDAWRTEMLARYGQWSVPAFAAGGRHAGGLRLVGEHGPELEVTGPSRIINSADTLAALHAGSGLADELRALRQEVAALREEQRAGNAAIASHTGKTARVLDKFDIDGLPAVRAA